MENNRYIRFDWAAKNMLRNKADYVVYEGFFLALLGEKVVIEEVLDGDWNLYSNYGKFRRVVIKAYNAKKESILIEIRNTFELDYLERWVYADGTPQNTSPDNWDDYLEAKKIYSINILYFDLGEGADYLYHGQTTLIGAHTKDTLRLTRHEREDLNVVSPENIFPEYYVIRVNEFDKLAVSPLDEWLQYLKDEYIRPDTTVPGLKEARERLEYLRMSPSERRVYDNYLDTLVRDTDVMKTKLLEARIEGEKQGRAEGRAEGRSEGRAEGRAEGIMATARNLRQMGLPVADIAKATGLSAEEIEKL